MLPLAAAASIAVATTEAYSTRPARTVVPLPPGAASDFLARVKKIVQDTGLKPQF